MKKIIICAAVLCITAVLQAQQNESVLIRHDTISARSEQCDWVISLMTKKKYSMKDFSGKSVIEAVFKLGSQGKIKLQDAATGEPIPADKIDTWGMAADSVMIKNKQGADQLITVLRKRNPDWYSDWRIYSDLLQDGITGKEWKLVTGIMILEEVQSPSTGAVIGTRPFCIIHF